MHGNQICTYNFDNQTNFENGWHTLEMLVNETLIMYLSGGHNEKQIRTRIASVRSYLI